MPCSIQIRSLIRIKQKNKQVVQKQKNKHKDHHKAEDEKTRGELDKELHTQIAKIADNPMIYSVLAAADQLIENIIAGTRDYIMKKNRPEFKVDEQHRLLVEAIINNDEKGAEQYMSEHMEIIEKCMDEMQKNSNNKRPANGIVIGGE